MKAQLSITVMAAVAMVLSLPAWADWNPGDPYKMHFPQLPDPNGWDINFESPEALADDWQCSESGPVSDIHFWLSSRNDISPAIGDPAQGIGKIAKILVTIHSDVPQGPNGFSIPGEILWERDFLEGDFTIRQYGDQAPQGWWDPVNFYDVPDDHFLTWQVNITDIVDPFDQVQDEVYWLALTVEVPGGEGLMPLLGWKTSSDHFRDDAAWISTPRFATLPQFFKELRDPVSDESLDLAFVITPEPATLSLLLLGGLAAFRQRRK